MFSLFIFGMGSILNPASILDAAPVRRPNTDAEGIASDWVRVGNDLRVAIHAQQGQDEKE